MATTSTSRKRVSIGSNRSLSSRITRSITQNPNLHENASAADSEKVPSSLSSVAFILRVANEVEKDNPRVAYLCRFVALEKAHNIDRYSYGRGVGQFKTYLLHRLEKEEIETQLQPPNTDPGEIQIYYKRFYENNIKDGIHTPEELAKIYQMADVLYDVLKTVVPASKIDKEVERYASDVVRKRDRYKPYNILPLYTFEAVQPAIMNFPEIKAVVRAICKVDNLPKLRTPGDDDKPIMDMFEWLSSVFGFQKGNVANQREHLILLLANYDARDKNIQSHYELLDTDTAAKLMDKVFKNYNSWCKYLKCQSYIRFPPGADKQQLEILYTGLYLLIWGEASNVRFMPECLCYIFHCMANEMCGVLFGNTHIVSGAAYQTAPRDEESFLKNVITPIYDVMRKEVKKGLRGKASHAVWRNYDDLNEYFWSRKCFNLKWPMDLSTDFFIQSDMNNSSGKVEKNRKPKTNFVEVRTFLHLYRSFDRMWIFFILALQVMITVAWHERGSLALLFDEHVFESLLTIFITSAVLNFLQATLDIILSWYAWKSLKFTQILRYILKFIAAGFWVVILPIAYARSITNPTGLVRFLSTLGGTWRSQSFYNYCVAVYLIPNVLAALLFLAPPLQRTMESSNSSYINLLMWWSQPKLYVGRGMHEDLFSVLKYAAFWIILLICKLAFSFYVEILPLIGPTKVIMDMHINSYGWHEFFPNETRNTGVIIAIWAPIIMIYFIDTQIWYAIFATVTGGLYGIFSHLGEIRNLAMLRSRFEAIPSTFCKALLPPPENRLTPNQLDDSESKEGFAKFSLVWNEFVESMRNEDLINDHERDMLRLPDSSSKSTVIQWPPFLLASKIPTAVDTARNIQGKRDKDLIKKINSDGQMKRAVIECYETLKDVLDHLIQGDCEKSIINKIYHEIASSIEQQNFLRQFRIIHLDTISKKLGELLGHLEDSWKHISTPGGLKQKNAKDNEHDIIEALQDLVEIITKDFAKNGRQIRENAYNTYHVDYKNDKRQRFAKINLDFTRKKKWRAKVGKSDIAGEITYYKIVRLKLLVTEKESAINVPVNLEARRRINFFTTSLYMKMPSAPKVRDMLSFSVLTPYYDEIVLYSEKDYNLKNEDGITTLFYLKKIYPDEYENFIRRTEMFEAKERTELTRHWVSNRGQTLSRTVRGMMYYKDALEIQSQLDFAEEDGISYPDITTMEMNKERAQALVDLKFTYVVSCQKYGAQKKAGQSQATDILNLMITHRSLRVAYIDEVEENVNENVDGDTQKVYYSVLVKGGEKLDEEIYRIKLPGSPIEIGEGKPENQNHAIIFTRGEALQTIDMNQDNYFEEALKMRNVLEEFNKFHKGQRDPTILGLREYIFTGSVSSLAWFMSNQEMSFVTIGQRVLANPLRVRFHYGHPDIFERLFHITRGGISKASKTINLSEDIFSGYNSTLRKGYIKHREYIQAGKGRDVGMNQISLFEAKVASGNGEQTLSRDVYRLGRRFDFYRMLSFYFTTIGFYFSSLVTVLTVYLFLYGRVYMVLSGIERQILENPVIRESNALEEALATQSVFQLGLLLVLPMIMEVGLERGFQTAVIDFIIMQLQLAPVFFTFHLGTKAHYYGKTILHGGSKYRATGRGFVVFHAKFSDNYRMYSRSHFVKGLELAILLVIYQVYGESHRSSKIYFLVTWSIWFMVLSFLFAPFIFNPSGFEWQKTVDDWKDWMRWIGNRGGIGVLPEKSWEYWWIEEQEHHNYTSGRGRFLEILLALRFFFYQYGIVYQLNVAHGIKSIAVYGVSWFVMVTALLALKIGSMGRTGFGDDLQLMLRILKVLLFFGFVSVMAILFLLFGLTISDLFASLLAFLPTGWGLLLIGQALKPVMECQGVWGAIMEMGRAYESLMGLVIFLPIVILSWFPFVSEFQTRLLFNQAFSRGLQISKILQGEKDD